MGMDSAQEWMHLKSMAVLGGAKREQLPVRGLTCPWMSADLGQFTASISMEQDGRAALQADFYPSSLASIAERIQHQEGC